MLIVAGHLYVDESYRHEYLTSCLEVMALAKSAAGCLDLVLSADPIEPDRINVYEMWETDEQLEAFRGAGPSADQATQIRGVDLHRYRIVSRAAAWSVGSHPGVQIA